jgi:NAD(P) transhydrogenase
MLGILGVASGVLASLVAVGFSPEVLAQFAAVAGIGSIIGKSAAPIFLLDLSYAGFCKALYSVVALPLPSCRRW